MFEMMNQQALSIGAERRREVALETMREVRASSGAAQHAVGIALISVGRRLEGEMPAPRATVQPDRDCVQA